jgi:hypothetical protein
VRDFQNAALLLISLFLTESLVLSATCPEPFNWQSVADAPIVRYEAQGLTIDGKLYLFGGFINSSNETTVRMDVYDPNSDSWSQVADVPEPLTHASHAADGEMIYVVGGFVGDHPGGSSDHVWIYDTINDIWSAGPNLPADRGGAAMARVDRQLHFSGGATRTAGQNNLFDYGDHYALSLGPTSSLDDDANSWTTATTMPNPRNHMGGAELNGQFYAIGGQHLGNESSGNQSDVHVYDPNSDSWSSAGDLPQPLGHITSSTMVWNGRIIIAVGVSHDAGGKIIVNNVIMYDPNGDSWGFLPSLPQARQSPVADMIDDTMFVASGLLQGLQKTTWSGHLPLLYGFPADVSGNDSVGVEDLLILTQSWLTSVVDFAPIPGGDGITNHVEFTQISAHWLLDCSTIYELMLGVSSDRASPVELADQTVSGNIYAFVLPESEINQVKFYLDDPNRSGGPIQTENVSPFDFAAGSVGTANPFVTNTLTNGIHNITAEVVLDGSSEIISADFTVDN